MPVRAMCVCVRAVELRLNVRKILENVVMKGEPRLSAMTVQFLSVYNSRSSTMFKPLLLL